MEHTECLSTVHTLQRDETFALVYHNIRNTCVKALPPKLYDLYNPGYMNHERVYCSQLKLIIQLLTFLGE